MTQKQARSNTKNQYVTKKNRMPSSKFNKIKRNF